MNWIVEMSAAHSLLMVAAILVRTVIAEYLVDMSYAANREEKAPKRRMDSKEARSPLAGAGIRMAKAQNLANMSYFGVGEAANGGVVPKSAAHSLLTVAAILVRMANAEYLVDMSYSADREGEAPKRRVDSKEARSPLEGADICMAKAQHLANMPYSGVGEAADGGVVP